MHIGKQIEAVFLQKGLKISVFASQLGTVRDNIYKIFKREDINTNQLLNISKVLGFDFFGDYSKLTNLNNTTNIQIEYLSNENKLLKEQLELQSKHIKALEKIIDRKSVV